jgi:hypothetical protein
MEALLPVLEYLNEPDPPSFMQHHTLRLSIALIYENMLFAALIAAKQRQWNSEETLYQHQVIHCPRDLPKKYALIPDFL